MKILSIVLILLSVKVSLISADDSGGKGSEGKDEVTLSLVTAGPSSVPTQTQNPTTGPSTYPTQNPTAGPSSYPTNNPTAGPSTIPTLNPTAGPSSYPTLNPTAGPSSFPTLNPTAGPSSFPTRNPTAGPSSYPTLNPTTGPSSYPTLNPTAGPSSYPTLNPTAGPSPEPTKEDVCPDNKVFTFGSFQYQGQTITRTCAWIVEAPQLEEKRRNRWCNERFQGDLVKDVCPTACDNCCKDNPRYKFGTYYMENGKPITRTCAWITSEPQLITQRRNNWCNAYRNRARVEDECPVACNECDNPPKPTSPPTKKRVENCPNDPAYTFGTFVYEGNTITRTCAWITRRPEITAQRRKNWCNRVLNGSLVKTKCRGACDNCCEDDVNYTFGTFPYNGGTVTRDCAWIVEAPQLVDRRRNGWCDKYVNDAQVDFKCPVACGDC